ncbi:hypothetical protein [Cerasicoccus maritimus]|uniref:hypothetical protein n=1 Tax=Cerasicoccus maritimus TaxID=490089 RepID=UPI002852A4F8|nr:hypothetical protein [Cerasicoccus maritimus]
MLSGEELEERALRYLEADRFSDFLELFPNQEQAYFYYAGLMAKRHSVADQPNAIAFKLVWRRIYNNFFFLFYLRHKEFHFETIHYFEKPAARKVQLWKSLGELARFAVFLMAMIAGVLLVYSVIQFIFAWNGRGGFLGPTATFIGMLIFIWLQVLLYRSSLSWGLPADIRAIGRGYFELRKISRCR